MDTKVLEHRILLDYIDSWIEGFLIDRKARRLSPKTIIFYKAKLLPFQKYCEANLIKQILTKSHPLLSGSSFWY